MRKIMAKAETRGSLPQWCRPGVEEYICCEKVTKPNLHASLGNKCSSHWERDRNSVALGQVDDPPQLRKGQYGKTLSLLEVQVTVLGSQSYPNTIRIFCHWADAGKAHTRLTKDTKQLCCHGKKRQDHFGTLPLRLRNMRRLRLGWYNTQQYWVTSNSSLLLEDRQEYEERPLLWCKCTRKAGSWGQSCNVEKNFLAPKSQLKYKLILYDWSQWPSEANHSNKKTPLSC